MKKQVITKCPICGDELIVKKLECKNCHSVIKGDFYLSKLNYLSNEQLEFVLIFIKNAGNIKLIEKELNISYPTVKKNLEDVIKALGFQVKENETKFNYESRKDVLTALKEEKITYEEAKELLKDIEG